MSNANIDLLKRVIETQHGGHARYAHSVRATNTPQRAGLWDGVVHVFSLTGNPKATQAYAWATPIDGSSSSQFFAVLHQGKVRGPLEAVKAALEAIRANAA